MEPGYGTDPEGDKQPTPRSAGKPSKRPAKSASAASHLPSPDIRTFTLFRAIIFLPLRDLSSLFHILASRPSLISHAREEPQRSSSRTGPPDSRPSVLVRSFPAAQFPGMNPSYPSNGSPFPQPHPAYHHPASTPGHSGNGVSSTPMAGQSHPSPYAYPVHHAPYPSHAPFPHYSPYPQQILMYAPPRPSPA